MQADLHILNRTAFGTEGGKNETNADTDLPASANDGSGSKTNH